ncbi:phosphoesterase PA-phosphatase related protein [Methanobacterium lacus]|jgi:membrane-associated phospholipid phosphatase|uniref:Phosphoesterase PA-phosphatase related protein n=1 Tax=Methanobacterium lacus (strain AL-21) TaxID=877455 RepID=F0T6R2_METLA|nr:phosphatase PAP2 family protein [Methanobacterium lacus]ADZ08295.1 phosphoesterase PA-phosphatase related protein [Methanobacterium lacus]
MDNIQNNHPSELETAKFISMVAHPPVISIPTFIILNYFLAGPDQFIVPTIISIIFGALIPISTSLILIKKMHTDLDITDRTKRTVPLIFAICSYLLGFLMLLWYGAPDIVSVLMLIYGTNTLLILIINFYWKISIHAMGIAGPTAAFIFTFGPLGIIVGLIIPLVMWSRLKLKKHTPSQVIAGSLLGLLSTWIQLSYLVPLIHP